MGCFKFCLCCTAMPLSVVVLVVAVVVTQVLPKPSCQVDGYGTCKHAEATKKPASCDAGVFLRITKQADLGLRHVPLKGELSFAALEIGSCTVEYSASCSSGSVQVKEKWACKSGSTPSPEPHFLGEHWEVCAAGSTLKIMSPVFDLTYDIEVPAGTSVRGCVALSAPGAFPALDAVRGAAAAQQGAIAAAKKKAGGCPTWRNEEERLARGEDFLAETNAVHAAAIRLFMRHSKDQLPALREGVKEERPEGKLANAAMFMVVMVSGGGHEGANTLLPRVNCGVMSPTLLPVPGLMVATHPEVAKLVSDPQQQRAKMIGGGSAECCFDETLPVFMSAGSPEHTQVRKLWDTVGVATMHEGEVPEITPPPDSTFFSVRRKLMAAAGIKGEMLDEIAPVVAPLFLEKLWGKKPSAEEASTIGAYGTFGGPCIMSQIVRRLPIVPGKIKAIRDAAVAFAMDSPVGKALGEEIKKPQYTELREIYAKRPKGVVGTAIQNLADASLFAGLIGTSTATMNCLAQMHRGPQYVKMFRQNSTAFIFEVMRTATAVAGSIHKLRRPIKTVIFGEEVDLPNGTLVTQMTGLGAGNDPRVFPDPHRFDSTRDNLGETMNWNGKTKYVMARDYKNAPRFCPGAALSVKIAIKVCHYFSKGLSES